MAFACFFTWLFLSCGLYWTMFNWTIGLYFIYKLRFSSTNCITWSHIFTARWKFLELREEWWLVSATALSGIPWTMNCNGIRLFIALVSPVCIIGKSLIVFWASLCLVQNVLHFALQCLSATFNPVYRWHLQHSYLVFYFLQYYMCFFSCT